VSFVSYHAHCITKDRLSQLSGEVQTNLDNDDPGYWEKEELDEVYLAEVRTRVEAGQLPDFINIHLL